MSCEWLFIYTFEKHIYFVARLIYGYFKPFNQVIPTNLWLQYLLSPCSCNWTKILLARIIILVHCIFQYSCPELTDANDGFCSSVFFGSVEGAIPITGDTSVYSKEISKVGTIVKLGVLGFSTHSVIFAGTMTGKIGKVSKYLNYPFFICHVCIRFTNCLCLPTFIFLQSLHVS